MIGVLSDTHGLIRPEALAKLRGSDLIIHAGDIGSVMYNLMYKSIVMIRKQIYLGERHNEVVRKLAKARRISEAEVIRQAIDGQGGHRAASTPLDPKAWARALKLMRSLSSNRGSSKGTKKTWNRADLYEDRLRRYDRRTR